MPQKCRFNFERHPKHIIVCEKSEERRTFVKDHYPDVIVTTPEECTASTGAYGAPLGGEDVVIEVAGSEDSFQLAWQSTRPNAIVTVVALYDLSLIHISEPTRQF